MKSVKPFSRDSMTKENWGSFLYIEIIMDNNFILFSLVIDQYLFYSIYRLFNSSSASYKKKKGRKKTT